MSLSAASQIRHFCRLRRRRVVLTAYDAPTAALLERSGVDLILVGDSLATVILGYASTREVSFREMRHHVRAVLRGVRNVGVIADLPHKSIRRGIASAHRDALRFVEDGCLGVKIEWLGPESETLTRRCVRSGAGVIGHVGLTPQSASPKAGFKVRGLDRDDVGAVLDAARRLENAGAFALVFECIPEAVTDIIKKHLSAPVVGIGAGRHTEAQVLVFQDVVGLTEGFHPRFLKRYAETGAVAEAAVRRFVREVQSGRFPAKKNTYRIKASALRSLREMP
ncbi:MAG: 3-methyl-2-oxobutanoate hydroxymethyltransferase [Candidatus Omnitrophica bacterium]|nr:3-methyl-2-oxobutanoate hydroxymethyltransferase [Candidatus Omnitrophota bacterium]